MGRPVKDSAANLSVGDGRLSDCGAGFDGACHRWSVCRTRKTGTAPIWMRTRRWTLGAIPTSTCTQANTTRTSLTCGRSGPTALTARTTTLATGRRSYQSERWLWRDLNRRAEGARRTKRVGSNPVRHDCCGGCEKRQGAGACRRVERREGDGKAEMPREVEGSVCAATDAVAAAVQTAGQRRSDLVGLQFGQMGQQFVLLRQTSEVMADHLVSA